MQLKLCSFLVFSGYFLVSNLPAADILLRLQPDASAPVINRIIATEKVLLDAAPAGEDWLSLELELPFEGYVPVASLNKSVAITIGTPVHYLPSANADILIRVKEGDAYEIVREKDEWVTARFEQVVTVYFQADAEASAPPIEDDAPPILNLPKVAPAAIEVERPFNPALGVGTTDPEAMPPENVVWNTAPEASEVMPNENLESLEPLTEPALVTAGEIMVDPAQTQASEIDSAEPKPDKAQRLLTGILIREIRSDGPAYSLHLQSPEGRFIAFVDLSEVFLSDLSPFIGQKVYISGQIHPLETDQSTLVIFAQSIRLSD